MKLRLWVNPNPPDDADSRSIERGGPEIASLSDPMAGPAEVTWNAMCRLRVALARIKADWNEDTQPIEKTWYLVWCHQLDEGMQQFLKDNPQLKASR